MLGQKSDEVSEIASLIRVKESAHVLVDKPSRLDMRRKGDHVKDESASVVVEPLALASFGEPLAGGSSANKVNCSDKSTVTGPLLSGSDVVVLGDARPVPVKDGAGVLVDLDLAYAGHPGPVEAEVEAADAGEGGQVPHATPPENPSKESWIWA